MYIPVIAAAKRADLCSAVLLMLRNICAFKKILIGSEKKTRHLIATRVESYEISLKGLQRVLCKTRTGLAIRIVTHDTTVIMLYSNHQH